MAYLALLWKARTVEKYRLKYEQAKLHSIEIMNAKNAQNTKITKTLYQKFCHYNSNTKKRISKTFLRYYPEGSAVYNFFYYLKTDQTFPNFLMKSVIGFVGGIVLTYLCFMFFVFQLSISLIHATIMSSVIGVLLTLGLAFSYRIRCLVFLLIPQFFSRVGRYTLTCYALVLILTGPATNTLKNSEVLSESLACAEEQIKTNTYQINESVRKPYNSMKESIGLMVGSVKQLAAKIKKTTLNLHRLTLSLAHSLQASFTWLNSVADSCNRKLGSPYDRCSQSVQHSIIECQAILGPWYSWLCDAGKLVKVACWPVKSLPAFCHVFDFANGNILASVSKKLNTFTERINSMLYLEVHVHHSYSFRSNSSRSANQVAAGIVTEIRNKADLMLTWLSWSSCVTSASLLLIIFRAKYYQHMYETRSRFDNRYVTKELIELDLKRLRQGKETVLPLNKREEGKYIKTSSFRLVSSERVHLSRSAVTITITTFKLLIHMVADYSLYWVLMTIRRHGLNQTPLQPGDPNSGPFVTGSALISKIMMSLVGSITLPLATPPPSSITCLPNPHPPDFHRYLQIGILIFLLWFFALFEPYGLRLRHVIMGLYRPERAKARAVWLFNHIQRTRGSFLKFARRKLHREFKYSTEKQHTFHRWLQEHAPCAPLKYFLGIYPDEPYCVLCGVIEECNECDGTLVSCRTPGCPGIFCTKCFSDIGELCTICLKPSDYGDFSDISLAKGSSEESDDEDSDSPCKEPTLHVNGDDDREGPSTSQPKQNRRWSLFRKKNAKQPEEYPLIEREEENEPSRASDKKRSKAMEVRHKRYTDYDLQGERRKVIVSLGEDTQCLICHNTYEICGMNMQDNFEINKAKKVLQHDTNNQIIKNEKRYLYNEENIRKRNKHQKKEYNLKIEDDLRGSRHNSSINESLAKFKQRLKQMRKYDLNRRYSYPIKKIRSSRTLVLKIQSSLKFRWTSRKRKRRLKTLSKSTSLIFNPKIISSAQGVCNGICLKHKRTRRYRRKTQLVKTSEFRRKIISLIGSLNVRSISSTAVEFSNDNDILEFNKDDNGNINLAMDHTKENYLSMAGPSNIETNKNIFQKDEPLKIKADKNEKNSPKLAQNEKFGRKSDKLYNLCASYWNVGRIFAPPVRIVNYFRNDPVPVLYDTTNHKKRKKVESSEKIKPRTSKKENEATRKYRLSTFLSEQDWMKKRCKESKSKIALGVKEDVLKELLDAESEEMKTLFRKTILEDKNDAVCGKGDGKDTKPRSPRKHYKTGSPEIQTKKSLDDLLRFSTLKQKIKNRMILSGSQSHTKINKDCSLETIDKKPKETNHRKEKKHLPEDGKKKTKKEHKIGHHKKIRIHVKGIDKEDRIKDKDRVKIKGNLKQNQEESFKELDKTMHKPHQHKESLDMVPVNLSNNQLTDVASSVEIIATRIRNPASQSMDYGGMSMSRSLEYYRSLGNRDFDPYVDFQDQASAEKKEKEVKEIQAVVKVNVEDAKAQTSDELARKRSMEKKSTYRMLFFKKSAGKTVTAKTSENKPKDNNFSETQTKKNHSKEKKKSSKEMKKTSKEMKKSSKEIKKTRKEIKESNKEMKAEKDKSINNVHKTKSEKNNNPFSMIVKWCHVYLERKKRVETSTNLNIPCLNDAEVGVFPVVQNNYCQYGETVPIHDQTTQVFFMKEMAQSMSHHSEKFRDEGIDAVTKLRNDTTQYTYSCRNAMTYCQDKRLKQRNAHKDASTIHFNALKFDVERDTMTIQNPTINTAVQCNMPLKFNGNKNAGDCVQDFNIAAFQPEKYPKINDEKTVVNEILQEFKPVSAPVRSEIKQTNVNKGDETKCPHCGAHSSSETTSSLGVFQSLPSMECNKYRNYDLESESETNSDGDDTKTTDTTVYTVSNVGYEQPRRKRTTKFKVSVVTKSNMATATETTKVCDVSTVTSDWWSPILERKNKRFTLEKKEVQVEIPSPKKKTFHDRGVGIDGKIVTFSSAAQIIPSIRNYLSNPDLVLLSILRSFYGYELKIGGAIHCTVGPRAIPVLKNIYLVHTHLNLMSPSRYLLESQKYYNELFSTDCPVPSYDYNERYVAEKRHSSNRRHVLKRKGYRVKRSDEPYIQKPQRMLSPFMEQVWTAETAHQRDPSSIYQKRNRAQKNREGSLPKGLQSKGVKKSKHPQRPAAKKPELKIKRGEVNLLTRRHLSDDDISLDSHGNSLTENGSF